MVSMYLILAILVGIWANQWNRSGFGWFLLAFIFSPVLMGIIMLFVGSYEDKVTE